MCITWHQTRLGLGSSAIGPSPEFSLSYVFKGLDVGHLWDPLWRTHRNWTYRGFLGTLVPVGGHYMPLYGFGNTRQIYLSVQPSIKRLLSLFQRGHTVDQNLNLNASNNFVTYRIRRWQGYNLNNSTLDPSNSLTDDEGGGQGNTYYVHTLL